MKKDDPNVKDSKGKIEEDTEKLLKDDPERKNEEDTKEKLKGDLKGKIEEDSKKMLKDEPKEGSSFVKRKPPKELLKGGLRDRSLFSWLRILVVTALWWAFIIGFLTSCFALMYAILYGSEEDSRTPYFVRNQHKYPDILPQPGVNIECKGTSCTVKLNRVLDWIPQPWNPDDDTNPSQKLKNGRTFFMKEELNEVMSTTVDDEQLTDIVVVTCYGAFRDDDRLLKGMLQDKAGFSKKAFPWNGDSKTKDDPLRQLTLDLTDTVAMKSGKEEEVTLYCQAWAKNIDTERTYLDKSRPNGGGSAVLVFKDGKVRTKRANE